MAIVVQEERRDSASLVRFIGWFAILIILAVAIYYIFFAAPELVVIPPTGNLSTIAPIANLHLNAQDVINSPAFQSLHSSIALPSPQGPAAVGRQNPFVSP